MAELSRKLQKILKKFQKISKNFKKIFFQKKIFFRKIFFEKKNFFCSKTLKNHFQTLFGHLWSIFFSLFFKNFEKTACFGPKMGHFGPFFILKWLKNALFRSEMCSKPIFLGSYGVKSSFGTKKFRAKKIAIFHHFHHFQIFRVIQKNFQTGQFAYQVLVKNQVQKALGHEKSSNMFRSSARGQQCPTAGCPHLINWENFSLRSSYEALRFGYFISYSRGSA